MIEAVPGLLRRLGDFGLRYLLPVVAAVGLIGFVGVPYIDHLLAQWFRSDIQLRARLVMTSIEPTLARLLEDGDADVSRDYLGRIAGDERLLGFAVCDANGVRIVRTGSFPVTVTCSTVDTEETDRITDGSDGLVEVSGDARLTGLEDVADPRQRLAAEQPIEREEADDQPEDLAGEGRGVELGQSATMLRRLDSLFEAMDAGPTGRSRLLGGCGRLAMRRLGKCRRSDRHHQRGQQEQAGEPDESGSAFHHLILPMRWAPGRPEPARVEATIR